MLSCLAGLWHTVNAELLMPGRTHHSCERHSLTTQLHYGTILGWIQHGAAVALLMDCLVEHSARLGTMPVQPSWITGMKHVC